MNLKKIFMPMALGAALALAGCASVAERAADEIEYLIPKSEAAPGEVYTMGFVVPPEVKGGVVKFQNKNYKMFRRADVPERRVLITYLPVPQIEPGEYPLECKFTLKTGSAPVVEQFFLQILPDFSPSPVEKVRLKKFNVAAYIQDRTKLKSYMDKTEFARRNAQDFLLPLGGEIMAGFKLRRQYGDAAEVALEGIEIAPASATVNVVNAPADGLVLFAGRLPMLGNALVLDHGFSFTTLYCHLKDLNVKPGEKVKRGAMLGHVGQTGDAAVGVRLFYQIYVAGTPIDVQRFSNVDVFKNVK